MNDKLYLDVFQRVADELDQGDLLAREIEYFIGMYGDSVVLKLFKRRWTQDYLDPVNSPSRIFFSIWLNTQSIQEERFLYNIHALKLRELKGYSITSRAFAQKFRERFKPFSYQWKNISLDYGPLTLMQGWGKLDWNTLQKDALQICHQFLEIENLIDQTLVEYRN